MTKSFFTLIVGLIFTFSFLFHFSRLALDWEIIINDWVFPSWISGIIVIFGIFMTYWSVKLKKDPKKDLKKEISEEND